MLPFYVPTEAYSFYINFENPINDPDFDDFRLDIYQGAIEKDTNTGTLQKQLIDGDFYNIYCDFFFPALPNGQYQFVIKDTNTGLEKARSNYFIVQNTNYDLISQRLEYSSELNTSNFYYETLPAYTNKFRLALSKIDYQFPSEKKQYRNITNKQLRTITSFRDKTVKIESYYFDESGHEAMSSVIDHSRIIIGGSQYYPKSGYSVSTNPITELVKGEFEAYEDQAIIVQALAIATLLLNQVSLQKIADVIALTGTGSLNKGIASQYDFYKLDVQEAGQPQLLALHDYGNYTVISGNQEFKVIITYTLDAFLGQAIGTSIIEGVYPLFATTVDVQTSTEQNLLSMVNANNIEITLAAETSGDKQFFEIPLAWLTARPLTQVLYYVNRISSFDPLNQISEFTITDVVNIIEGQNVDYKLYTYNGIDRGSILIKLIF